MKRLNEKVKRKWKRCSAGFMSICLLAGSIGITDITDVQAADTTSVVSSASGLRDRGVVAVALAGAAGAETSLSATDAQGNEYTSGVYVSWRSFEGDTKTTYDVYRDSTLIADDITVTNLVDEAGTADSKYRVVGSTDEKLHLNASAVEVWDNQYQEFQLYKPEDETMPDGTTCTYTANDMSVGDLDGDGELDLIVKWYPSNARDNSQAGYTGKTFIDGYQVDWNTGDAKMLWRVDMGINIRSGAHYTQFQMWDFDGDGITELAVKTADGTTTYQSADGTDQTLTESGHVGKISAKDQSVSTYGGTEVYDYRTTEADSNANRLGRILDGDEYYTFFNGEDGTIIASADYIPERGNISTWGDQYGNRVDRFNSGVAYVNGTDEAPAAVTCRGYYTRIAMAAYYLKDTDKDGIGDSIDTYWVFDTDNDGAQYEAQGNHGLSINDVDGDGCDEIVYGSLCVDHTGKALWSTDLEHGDAMHVSDWIPSNPGLEIMDVHEHPISAITGQAETYSVEIHDAATGKILMGYYNAKDTGRGMAADIDPTSLGGEWWASYGTDGTAASCAIYAASSTTDELVKLSDKVPSMNYSILWDGDLTSELLDGDSSFSVKITNWNYLNDSSDTQFLSSEVKTSNTTKNNPGLVADILGDWREEVIARCAEDATKVRVYTTTIQTDYVVPCLLEDLAYREGVAWQNVGYNQPANTSYLMSEAVVTAQLSNDETNTTTSQAAFTFTAASDGVLGGKISGYNVYRKEAASDHYVLIDTIENTDAVVSYVDKNVTADTTYSYEVAALVTTTGTTKNEAELLVPAEKTNESYLSRPLSVTTKLDIASVGDFSIPDIAVNASYQESAAELLPATVPIINLEGATVDTAITWDTSELDITKVGSYIITGTIRGYEQTIVRAVNVIENSISSVDPIYVEVAYNGDGSDMPQTIAAKCLDGSTTDVPVRWNTVDTLTLGNQTVNGTIDGYAGEVVANVTVAYPAVSRYDFGITTSPAAEGWTNLVMNAKGGGQTAEALGSQYTAEKGYGIVDAATTTEGRYSTFDKSGVLPSDVYSDYIMMNTNTFLADVANGTYQVDLVSGTAGSSQKIAGTIEGISFSGSASKNNYTIISKVVDIIDGQVEIAFTGTSYNAVSAIILRPVITDANEVAVSQLTMNHETAAMTVGESLTLAAQILPANADNKSVTWASSDESIATVENGVVTAKKAGSVEVTATAADGSAQTTSCAVTVSEPVTVTGITLADSSLELVIGEQKALTAQVLPEGSNAEVSWSSDNTTVVQVSAAGVISAIGTGTANITCKSASDETKTAVCQITVTEAQVTAIKLDQESMKLAVGASQKLMAEVKPGYAADYSLTWTSQDEKKATVASDGTVTALSEGTVNITCSLADGSVSASCTVTVMNTQDSGDEDVSEYIEVSRPEAATGLVYTSKALTGVAAATGYTVAYGVGTNPGKYTAKVTLDAGYKWSDGSREILYLDWEIAKASPNYKVPTGLSALEGHTLSEVVLSSAYTWKDASQKVGSAGNNKFVAIYTPPDNYHYKAIEITVTVAVSANSITEVKPVTVEMAYGSDGAELPSTVDVVRADGTADKATVEWEKPDTTTVGEQTINGTVAGTALKATATVTITKSEEPEDTEKPEDAEKPSDTEDKNPQVSTVKVNKIVLTQEDTTIAVGKNYQIVSAVLPANASNPRLNWSTSNAGVAVVSTNGTVTGKGKGTAIITARAADGSGIRASYTIKVVKNAVSKLTLSVPGKTVAASKKTTVTANVKTTGKDANKKLVWTSSNTKYATVSSKGVVTTKKAGKGKTVTITAQSTDGSAKSASVKIKIVKDSVKKVKITASTKTVSAGKKLTLKVKVTTTGKTAGKTIAWTSSNTKYATVSSKGVVKTKKAGKGKTVKITAKATDGSGKKATIKIKIK